jgi:ribonuclease E
MCEGHGAVRTTESAALVALRKIHNRVALGDAAGLRAALPTAVALYLLNQKRDELARLEQRYDTRLAIELKDSLMPHQMELEVRERAAAERVAAVPHGGVAEADAPAAAATGNGAAIPAGSEGTGKKKRRRRGRRRGSGLRAAAAIGDALATLGGASPLRFEDHSPSPHSAPAIAHEAPAAHPADDVAPVLAAAPGDAASGMAQPPAPAGNRRSRRSRRGGRRRRGGRVMAAAHPSAAAPSVPAHPSAHVDATSADPPAHPEVSSSHATPAFASPPGVEAPVVEPPAKRARRTTRQRAGGTRTSRRRPEESSGSVATEAPPAGESAATKRAPRTRRSRPGGSGPGSPAKRKRPTPAE